jgi:metal-dependent amidase/aminoacylase/carboxypeptidase family protein
MTAKPGSEMAEQISASKKAGASRFGGFLMDGAAMTANMTSQIAPNQIEQTLSVMKNSKEQIQEMLDANPNMTDAQAEMTEELVDSLLDVVMKTVEDGRMDMGAVMMMNDGEMNFAMGVEAANPKKLEDAVKDVVKMVEKEVGDEVQFNLNAGSHRGTTFHEILVEVPSSEEEAQQIFGDQLTLVIGIAKDAVYFAMGSDPEDVLKQAMDKSAESSDSKADMPMQVNFYLSPILKFASGIQGMEMMEMMSDTLQSGGDRIQIRSEFIDNGTKTRFEIQDGILELLGAAGGMMGGMGGGGADF